MKINSYISTCNKAIIRETVKLYFANATDIKNSISENMYIDKLDDIVNKCNNTYHSTIKMKPVDVKLSTYIDFNKENIK